MNTCRGNFIVLLEERLPIEMQHFIYKTKRNNIDCELFFVLPSFLNPIPAKWTNNRWCSRLNYAIQKTL